VAGIGAIVEVRNAYKILAGKPEKDVTI